MCILQWLIQCFININWVKMLDDTVHTFCVVLLVIEGETTKSLTMSVVVSVCPFMLVFPSCILKLRFSSLDIYG